MSDPAGNPRARRQARRALLQALYAWQIAGAEVEDLHEQSADNLRRADGRFFDDCLRGVVQGVDALDALFASYLDRSVDALDHVERAILRAGAFELKERLDVPARVVINEWVELAKTFGATDSFKYVNGVLDRVARTARAAEMGVE